MKKLVFTALMLVSGSSLFAQTKFGIKAGVNFASAELKEEGFSFSISPSSRLSFNLTGFADVPLSETFSFQPGLAISGKGFKVDESFNVFGEELKIKQTTDLMYLEIPLNTVAKFQAGTGKFFIGTGPYLGYGLSGKHKSEISGLDEDGKKITEKEEGDIKFGNDKDLKAIDFGLNFLAGYELSSGISLNAGYGLGLSNLAQDSDGSFKNKVFSISVGFSF